MFLVSNYLVSHFLGDFDPAAHLLSLEEAIVGDWDKRFDDLLDSIADNSWISIVESRLAKRSAKTSSCTIIRLF